MLKTIPRLFLNLIKNRIHIFSLELQEEKIRVIQLLALVIIGSILGITAIIGLGVLLIFLIPEENRILVASLVFLSFLLISLGCFVWIGKLIQKHPPFESTLGLLNQDLTSL